MGNLTCTDELVPADVSTCSGKAMTRPVPVVAVPAGTSTATRPVTCVVGELMVLTTTPELEPTDTLLEAPLLEDVLLADAAEPLAA